MNTEMLDKKFSSDSKTLEKEIMNIELRQQEIQNVISTLDQSISDIEHLIMLEKKKKTPDGNKIKNLRGALLTNTQILNEFYNTYRGYEEVKFRYRKLITDKGLDYEKLKSDLEKLDRRSKFDNEQLLTVLEVISSKINERKTSQQLIKDGHTEEETDIIKETTCELSCHDEYAL